MSKFMITTCLLLFWVFYEMSGGADFEPRVRERLVAEVPTPEVVAPIAATPVAEAVEVAAVAAIQAAAPLPVLVVEPPMLEIEPQVLQDLRQVSGEWVNMRAGPGTAHSVVDTLPRGTMAEIIDFSDNGWAQIRLLDTGEMGWMAANLLTDG